MRLQGLQILTMVPEALILHGDLRIEGAHITGIGKLDPIPGETVKDFTGHTVTPGFVQGHVHLCQTLFRNLAEDLPLLQWLEKRIWPLEAAHDENSLRISARLALTEMIRGGCTTFQSMETTRGTEFVFDEVLQSGLRGVLGNALMDVDSGATPSGLCLPTSRSLEIASRLAADWDGKEGRIHYAWSPRFLLSCTNELLQEVATRSRQGQQRIHTHASEHADEVAWVQQQCGKSYIAALADLDLLGPRTALAHCVHIDETEIDLLASSGTSVLHCPSTNLKLGSGIARVVELRKRGVAVGLGSDGAPANNRLCSLTEMRQAALLQQWREGPGRFSARDALDLATRGGAEALGLQRECGTIEVGKAADLAIFDLRDPILGSSSSPYEKLVYSAERSHLRSVMAGGRFVLEGGCVQAASLGVDSLAQNAEQALQKLTQRASL